MSVTLDKKSILALFELPHNYNAVQLKNAYKKLVLKYHPDKTMLTEAPMFQMLSNCYKTLSEDLKTRMSQREFHDLKADFHANRQDPQPTQNVKPTSTSAQNSRKFDSKVFNKLFDQHKIKDVHEDGYSDWMRNPESFKEKSKHAVVVYKEPQPLVANDIAYYDLGVDKVKDHSAHDGTPLQYSDYRLAHTTEKIIDTDVVKPRKEYRNFQELQVDRSKVQHVMTQSELEEYMQRKHEMEAQELARRQRQEKYDEQISSQYQKINNTLMFQALKRY